MSNDELTPGWKAAIIVSLVLSTAAVGLSAFRGPGGGDAGYEGRIASLEGRLKALQMQPTRPGVAPSDRSLGE